MVDSMGSWGPPSPTPRREGEGPAYLQTRLPEGQVQPRVWMMGHNLSLLTAMQHIVR